MFGMKLQDYWVEESFRSNKFLQDRSGILRVFSHVQAESSVQRNAQVGRLLRVLQGAREAGLHWHNCMPHAVLQNQCYLSQVSLLQVFVLQRSAVVPLHSLGYSSSYQLYWVEFNSNNLKSAKSLCLYLATYH